MKTLLPLVLLASLGSTMLIQDAGGATFSTRGVNCVQHFTTSPSIKFDNTNGTAVNSSTSTRNYFCSGTSNSDKTLQSVNVVVVDRSTVGAVECSAFNGSFSVGPGASAGSDASLKTISLNITNAGFFDAIVKCDIPAFASGLGSGVTFIEWITN